MGLSAISSFHVSVAHIHRCFCSLPRGTELAERATTPQHIPPKTKKEPAMQALNSLRAEIQTINAQILALLNRRAALVCDVQARKTQDGLPTYLPEREQAMLDALLAQNQGPFSNETIAALFKEIFRASVALMEQTKQAQSKLPRAPSGQTRRITIRGAQIGAEPILIAGPCSIESTDQMDKIGIALQTKGLRFVRGGAFKPRTSPYAFQGLGEEGLRILRDTAQRFDLISVTEVTDTRRVGLVAEYADILQIGARNMYNYDLLREVGRTRKPVLLKRAFSATLDEALASAEYILCEGNEDVILCERGIRTFEKNTRNTLDISAIPLWRQACDLPVIVDVSHAAGRKDILLPLARAALAVGAHGVMVETHPSPQTARSDGQQQLTLPEFQTFFEQLFPPKA